MGPAAAPPSSPGRAGRAAALAGLAALVIASTLAPITNNDLFLHLRTGSIVLATGSVPRVDDYSALAHGRPFVAHEWLAGVIFRLVERAFGSHGFEAIGLLKVAVALLTVALLLRTARHLGADRIVAIACAAVVMLLAAARFLDRPHIFSYLLLASFLLILARRRARRAAGGPGGGLWLLLLLEVAWANLHGSFLLGPALVGLAAVAEAIEGQACATAERQTRRAEATRLALVAAALIPAALLNPYGVELLRFPFALTGSAFMGQIYEWLPPWSELYRSTYMARYYVIWAAIGIAAHGAVLARARRAGLPPAGLFPALLFAAFFVLSLRMNRNVTDFALATCPGVAAALTSPRPRRGTGATSGTGGAVAANLAAGALAALLAGSATWFAIAGYPLSPSSRRPFGLGIGPGIPVAAADYVERNGIRGNAFNTYSAGAYLVYRFHPAVRVGMDSRNDVYGEDLWDEYTRALVSPTDLARMTGRLDATFMLIEWPQQGMVATAAAIRDLSPAWRPVYFDDDAVVYLGVGGPYAALLGRDGYGMLDPALFRPGSWSEAGAGTALTEADRAIAASGGACIARVMRIEALRVLGRRSEAETEEARLVAEDPPLYHIQILLGLTHLARGERALAAARLRRALELNPASQAARQALDQALSGG